MTEHSTPSARESSYTSGDVALLRAIEAALDAAPDELADRVALVRRYVGVAVEIGPVNRRAAFKVIAQMITRDLRG